MIFSNRNQLWATLMVEELASQGLATACIAPGSRSTPLTLALFHHADVNVFLHHDERCAAFFALGVAQASERPVVLVCTSGTAAANFHPAVIEAFHAHVPLIVLTTDRPFEQRNAGANQTIDQVGMYGAHALWSVDVAPPEANAPDRVLRYVRTVVARAYGTANGLRKGPVHLNIPFRKPLEPTPEATDQPSSEQKKGSGFQGRGGAFTRIGIGHIAPSDEQIEQIAELVSSKSKGLIVCGPRCPQGEFAQTITVLAERSGYPILADPLSGVRFGPHVSSMILGHYETFLRQNLETPDVVLRFGAMPTSKFLGQKLSEWPQAYQILVSAHGQWQDPTHTINQMLWADPILVCQELIKALATQSADQAWIERWLYAERVCQAESQSQLNEHWMEEAALSEVIEQMPNPSALFIANSLPVRHLDQFVAPATKGIKMFANRGASGIDGLVSSAAGAGSELNEPMVLVIGDTAFYHDMNGLLALKRNNIRLTIVVLNNDGGGIFRRLQVSEIEPPFNDLFLAPHALNFETAATMYGLNYHKAKNRESFVKAFSQALSADHSTIIEVPFNSEHNHKLYQSLVEKMTNRLKAQEAI